MDKKIVCVLPRPSGRPHACALMLHDMLRWGDPGVPPRECDPALRIHRLNKVRSSQEVFSFWVVITLGSGPIVFAPARPRSPLNHRTVCTPLAQYASEEPLSKEDTHLGGNREGKGLPDSGSGGCRAAKRNSSLAPHELPRWRLACNGVTADLRLTTHTIIEGKRLVFSPGRPAGRMLVH